jgi:hypothetical protein
MKRTSRIALLSLVLIGCGADGPPPRGALAQAAIQVNGKNLNGKGLNGKGLNGVSLGGVRLGDAAPGHAWLEGSELRLRDASGAVLGGADLRGAELSGVLDDGEAVPLRIDDVAPAEEQGDVLLYRVSVRAPDGWVPLCGTDPAGADIAAIALAGRWDPRQGVPGGGSHIADPDRFTFACDGFALAKCVRAGYAPWRSAALASHHQACTRLLRADYCGDGRTFTKDGTVINLYDDLGVQQDTEAWPFEAEWDESGARCLSRRRISQGAPTCGGRLRDEDCGGPARFATGTLLMSEAAP